MYRMNPETTQNISPAEKKNMPRNDSVWHSIREWAQVVVIALVIALPIRWFIAEPFIVNGASMDPTFATGQFLVVDRLTYDFEKPQRGDVIVLEYPNDPSTYYIKRIIGLPGETVNISDGKVTIINKDHPQGFTLDEPYIDPAHASHDTSTRTLTSTQYFVMGDNRAESSDSRYWGPLESHFIVGRPIVRLLPLSTLSLWPGQESQ
jgi:signal peptidase I